MTLYSLMDLQMGPIPIENATTKMSRLVKGSQETYSIGYGFWGSLWFFMKKKEPIPPIDMAIKDWEMSKRNRRPHLSTTMADVVVATCAHKNIYKSSKFLSSLIKKCWISNSYGKAKVKVAACFVQILVRSSGLINEKIMDSESIRSLFKEIVFSLKLSERHGKNLV